MCVVRAARDMCGVLQSLVAASSCGMTGTGNMTMTTMTATTMMMVRSALAAVLALQRV